MQDIEGLYVPDLEFRSRLLRWSDIFIWLVSLIAILVIIGWEFDIGLFIHPLSGRSPMNPLTALCFIAVSASFLLITHQREKQTLRFTALALAGIPILVGILRSLEILFGLPVPTDTLLFQDKLRLEEAEPGSARMSLNTALNLLLTGLCLLMADSRQKMVRAGSSYLALLTGFLALFFIIGYLYDVRSLNPALRYIPMAIHTGICFILFSLAHQFRLPEAGIIKAMGTKTSGGLFSRIIIPATILVPVLTGLILLIISRSTEINPAFSSVIFVITLVIFFFLLNWYVSGLLNKKDLLRLQAEERTLKLNRELEMIVEKRTAELSDYKYALDESSIVSISNEKGSLTYVNKNFTALTGYTKEELGDHPFYILNREFNSAAFIADVRNSISSGKIWRGELKNKTRDEHIYWADTTIVPFVDERNKPFQYIVIQTDITERKKAAVKIQELLEEISNNEQKFRGLIERNYDLIRINDEKFNLTYRSPNYERITGWGNTEITDANEVIHPEDMQYVTDNMKQVLENPGVPIAVSFRYRHKQGHYIWMEGTSINLLNDPVIRGIVSNLRDVTPRKEAIARLERSEKIYRTIVSGIPGSSIFLFDKDFNYLLAEGELAKVFGYTKEKMVGRKVTEVLSPESAAIILEDLKKVFNGSQFQKERHIGEYDILTRYVPLTSHEGNVENAMVVALDITDLKKAERRIAELNIGLEKKVEERTRMLEQVNRELEAFSYSVSHDLRAPLRIINGFAGILQEDYSGHLDPEGIRILQVIKDNAGRMGQLIDDLLNLSRLGKQELVLNKVNMLEVVQQVIREQATIHDGQLSISCSRLEPARCDKNLIQQVWSNLLSNAIKYSSQKQRSEIEIGSRKELNELIYFIKDNGAGFDMKYIGKLFGVFQRLHKDTDFEGTGVGLAIVQRIITRHQGRVWAESEPGKGSCFYFSLPLPEKSSDQ